MPDTYTSQFSGEEIDAALRAAQIISGADTPAALREKLEIRGDTIPVSATDPTPISEALTTSGGGVNPNLLDNWYFGRPVNQRNGYYIPAGVKYNTLSWTEAGTTDKAYPVIGYSGQDPLITVNGTNYIVGKSAQVPGYCGEWVYTIDRWEISEGTLTVNDGSISHSGGQLFHPLSDELSAILKGKRLTLSFLYADGSLESASAVVPSTWGTWDAIIDYASIRIFGVNNGSRLWVTNVSSAPILAAKLELGDTQTLAHKEGGVWVLNEIPDFGEQLRRCQRYARAYKCLLGQTFLPLGAYRSDWKAVSFALPTSSFRAVPTVSALNDIFQLFDGANVYGITSLAVTDYSDGLVTIYAYTSQPFENGKVLWLFSNTGTLLLSADL